MKIRGNKGITLISLTVTVIILLVITGAIIYNSKNQLTSRRINDLKLDIELLNAKVDDYFLRNGELPVLCYYTDKVNFAEILNKVAASQHSGFNEELNANDGDEYVVIDIEKLGGITLNYGYEPDGDYSKLRDGRVANADTATDIELYVINTTSHQIYFPHGVFADNIMYYTLNSDKYHVNADISALDKRRGIEVGDYISYTPPTRSAYTGFTQAATGSGDQTLPQEYTGAKWRVMKKYEDGSLDIVAAVTDSNKTIGFSNAVGYNNVVFLLDDACKNLYENTAKGITARSIDYEDITGELVIDEDGKGKRKIESYISTQVGNLTVGTNNVIAKNGNKITYKTNTWYPLLYKKQANESDPYYTSATTEGKVATKPESLEVEYTRYLGTMAQNDFKDYTGSTSNFYKAVFQTNTAFWLASRCAICYSSEAYFGLRRVVGTDIRSDELFYRMAALIAVRTAFAP